LKPPSKYFVDDDIAVQEDVLEKAKQGNAEAICTIGRVYASKENMDMAILWLGTSSALGFYESQLWLGDLFKKDYPARASTWYNFAFSNGVKRAGIPISDKLLKYRRYKDAEEEYIKATENGDPYCQNYLGVFYRDGYYTRRGYNNGVDSGEAFKWFQKAADQNYTEAQYNIAQLYENGEGVVENKYTALHWYERSKAGGYENADKCIEKLNKEGYFYFPHGTY
jgi:TPR repeat protein